MKQLRWAPAAANDLDTIDRYLEQHHPEYRAATIQRLYNAARSLKTHPYKGRIGHKEGTRELVLAPLPYLLVYAVEEQIIHILRFLHTAQDWQSL